MEKGKTEVDGISIAYTRLGEGPPMIMLGGLIGRDVMPAAEVMSQHFEVYVIELPGYWDSSALEGKLNMPRAGQIIAEFKRQILDETPTIGFGFSAGGTILVKTEQMFHSTFSELVLFEPIVRGKHLVFWLKAVILLAQAPPLPRLIVNPATVILLSRLPGVSHIPITRTFRLVEGIKEPRNAAELGFSIWQVDVRKFIHSLRLPIHIIHGDKDRIIPVAGLREVEGGWR